LVKRRIIDDIEDGVRILGDGELTKPLTVYAHHFSASAKAKIEAAGGKAVVISS
jgi:large subunit ribosomal protein L15